jgi:cobalamin biosynthesis protein CobD/CbiB
MTGTSPTPRLGLHFSMRCVGGHVLDLPLEKQNKYAHSAVTQMTLDGGTKLTCKSHITKLVSNLCLLFVFLT